LDGSWCIGFVFGIIWGADNAKISAAVRAASRSQNAAFFADIEAILALEWHFFVALSIEW
jgi:hypothetical protein